MVLSSGMTSSKASTPTNWRSSGTRAALLPSPDRSSQTIAA
jgi:hypothetical protein